MLQRNYFLIIAFLLSMIFSGIAFADNDNEEESEPEPVDLFKVRDTTLKSFSILKNLSSLASVDAEIRGDDLVLFVKDYIGVVDVDVTAVSGSGSVGKALYVHGSDYFVIDLSTLAAGEYEIELNAGTVKFVGQFSID
ncbi:DUF3244 domain-containing protein [Marinilabilia salmonicolor]|nr:DUF3244 domain-containing protein [Marinilabilia salmonicolor]